MNKDGLGTLVSIEATPLFTWFLRVTVKVADLVHGRAGSTLGVCSKQTGAPDFVTTLFCVEQLVSSLGPPFATTHCTKHGS